MTDEDPRAWSYLRRWRAALDTSGSDKEEGAALADRGDRAILRRCRDLDAVMLTPVFYGVRDAVRRQEGDLLDTWEADERLAAVVGLLAWVESDNAARPFCRQLGRKRADSEDALISGLRFRRLLEARDRRDLFVQMRGALDLLHREVNVRDFATDLFYWSPDTTNRVRRKWAEGYYSAAPREA